MHLMWRIAARPDFPVSPSGRSLLDLAEFPSYVALEVQS
jgi:hypothetical protein